MLIICRNTLQYEVIVEPIGAGNCHCRTCQKSVAPPYTAVLFVPYQALIITGKFKNMRHKQQVAIQCTEAFVHNAAHPVLAETQTPTQFFLSMQPHYTNPNK